MMKKDSMLSGSNKPHFLARKIQDFQRLKAQGYVCPLCEDGFQQEPKLWEHAKGVHGEALTVAESGDESEARKKFEKTASERAYVTTRYMTSLRESNHHASHNPALALELARLC